MTEFKWKYFQASEFDDKTTAIIEQIDPHLGVILDLMRGECSFPFIITSGVRSVQHNKDVGGKPDSDHLIKSDGFGHAVDIAFANDFQLFKILKAAFQCGVKRIGIGKKFVHIGNWEDNPQEVVWQYND
jgi:hypothetical protein